MRKGGGMLSSLSRDLKSLRKNWFNDFFWEAVAPDAANCGTRNLNFWNCHKKIKLIMFFFLRKWTPINFFSLLYVSYSKCCVLNQFLRWNHKLWQLILGTWTPLNQIRVHKKYWQDEKIHQFTIFLAKYTSVRPVKENKFLKWGSATDSTGDRRILAR